MGGTELCGKKALMPSIQTSAESGWNWVQREERMEGGDDKWYWEEGKSYTRMVVVVGRGQWMVTRDNRIGEING